jgi:hypothetical protein
MHNPRAPPTPPLSGRRYGPRGVRTPGVRVRPGGTQREHTPGRLEPLDGVTSGLDNPVHGYAQHRMQASPLTNEPFSCGPLYLYRLWKKRATQENDPFVFG